MRIKKSTNQILTEIFSPDLSGDMDPSKSSYLPPSLDEIKNFARLLAREAKEEALQQYLNQYPHFLFRAVPTAGNTNLGMLIKPPIGNSYKADYAILSAGQGGCTITLVEIEKSTHALFTKKLSPNKYFQHSLNQILDWNQWINSNKGTFGNDMIELLKRQSLLKKQPAGKSFKFLSDDQIDASWNAFGGSNWEVYNVLVIGRWAQLSNAERKRLLLLNTTYRQSVQIRTYDQLIRRAIEGPQYIW